MSSYKIVIISYKLVINSYKIVINSYKIVIVRISRLLIIGNLL